MLETLAKALDVGIEELIYGEKRNVGLEAPKPDHRRAMIIVFSILGSLLTATGLIIVLASFWDKIPEIFLAVLSFVPLLLGGGLAIGAHIKKPNSIGWTEGASVAWIAGLVATFYLIVSLFNVDLSFNTIYSGLSVMILPIGFLMNAAFPMAVNSVLTTIMFVGNLDKTNAFIVSALLVFSDILMKWQPGLCGVLSDTDLALWRKKGKSNKIMQYGFYTFYPVHMFIFYLILYLA